MKGKKERWRKTRQKTRRDDEGKIRKMNLVERKVDINAKKVRKHICCVKSLPHLFNKSVQ